MTRQTNLRDYWREKFPDIDSVMQQHESAYRTLLKLFCHENAIPRLVHCRINPNFNHPIRDDLEFYVPQIW